MKKKQNYLLLELMIALSVAGFVLFLLIHHPYAVLKKEYELLSAIDAERLREKRLVGLKIRAYGEAAQWVKQGIQEEDCTISCKKASNSTDDHQYYLVTIKWKKPKKTKDYFFIRIEK